MHAPGVEVRPLRQITGEAEFNEVYLTDVRVPDADRIGDVGEGWRVSMTTLDERAHHDRRRRRWRRPRARGRRSPRQCASGSDEAVDRTPGARDRLMQMWCEAEVLRLTNLRASPEPHAGQPGPEGSIAKLMFAEVNQRIYELCVDLLGPARLDGLRLHDAAAEHLGLEGPPGCVRQMFLRSRANSIEGGTSEIQRTSSANASSACPASPGRQGAALEPGSAVLKSTRRANPGWIQPVRSTSVLNPYCPTAMHVVADTQSTPYTLRSVGDGVVTG